MTPEQLKASILQMAIQGKLVEQRSEEGTADELLNKIFVIKKQLIKDKIIKKQKEQEPVKEDEIPFDIPTSWKWVKWGDVVNIVSARRVHQSDWKKEGIPFYRAREIAEMARTNGIVDNELYISEELFEEFSASGVPQAGDIMVTAVGTLGKTYIVKESDKFYYKDASVICFENRYGMCPEYLSMLMQTPLMLQQIKSNSEGTTVATLTMVRMVEYIFPLPPVDEQKRIVAKIEELLPHIDRYAEAYEKLEKFNAKFPEDMKKSILLYAIQGKLVKQRSEEGTAEDLFQQLYEEKQRLIKEGKIKKEKPLAEISEDEIPFEIPDSWIWVRLRDVCTKIVDGDHNPPAGNNQPTEYFMLSATNINYDSIVELDKVRYVTREVFEIENQRTNVEVDDIFFTIVGSMGRSCVYKGGMNICFQRSVSVLTTLIYPEFLKCVLDSPYIQNFMYVNATGTAQKGFYLKQVENLVIPLPPIKEQHRIVAKIDELLPYCERLVK